MSFVHVKRALQFFSEVPKYQTELPFELIPSKVEKPRPGDVVEQIAGFSLIRKGYLETGAKLLWDVFVEPITVENADAVSAAKWVAATLILKYRHDSAWTLEQTLELGSLTEKLYLFFLNERNAIAPEKPAAEAAEESPAKKRTGSKKSVELTGDSEETSPQNTNSAESNSHVATAA